jgi:hypothetical protein
MDWGKLIADNFDKVLVIIGTLLGGVLGGGITYFVQSRLQGRQREWALDDQRRQWRRTRLESLATKVTEIVEPIGFYSTKEYKDFDINSVIKTVIEIGILKSAIYDDELEQISTEFGKLLSGFIRASSDNSHLEIHSSIAEVQNAAIKLRHRIDQLIVKTYGPPPSLLQRIIKRLTPKRSNNKRSS